MIDPIRQACYELLKRMEEAWKMGGYWKMSEGARGIAAAVSNLLIEMGLALITEAGAAQSAPRGQSPNCGTNFGDHHENNVRGEKPGFSFARL